MQNAASLACVACAAAIEPTHTWRWPMQARYLLRLQGLGASDQLPPTATGQGSYRPCYHDLHSTRARALPTFQSGP
eukprot:scaffold4174_cov122-Isochrysis_galbana.AAC.5